MGKVLKSWMMLFAMSLALAGTATLSSCSSDDDPFFTVSEDDDPRILNTDLADQTLDRKTKLNLEIKVTPVHYTTVTWLLDDTQIAEGTTIDQTLPVGNHTLKIVATTTKGKSTSRTVNVTVTPAADDPALGTNAIEQPCHCGVVNRSDFNFQVQFGLAIQLQVSQVGVQDTRIVIF